LGSCSSSGSCHRWDSKTKGRLRVRPRRAPVALASGAAGVGGHPVQGRGPQPPEYAGLSSGHKGSPGGDLAVGDMLAGLAALSAAAPLPRGQALQRMQREASWDWVGFEVSVMRGSIALENIYTLFCIKYFI
jgi:hypothetical protein